MRFIFIFLNFFIAYSSIPSIDLKYITYKVLNADDQSICLSFSRKDFHPPSVIYLELEQRQFLRGDSVPSAKTTTLLHLVTTKELCHGHLKHHFDTKRYWRTDLHIRLLNAIDSPEFDSFRIDAIAEIKQNCTSTLNSFHNNIRMAIDISVSPLHIVYRPIEPEDHDEVMQHFSTSDKCLFLYSLFDAKFIPLSSLDLNVAKLLWATRYIQLRIYNKKNPNGINEFQAFHTWITDCDVETFTLGLLSYFKDKVLDINFDVYGLWNSTILNRLCVYNEDINGPDCSMFRILDQFPWNFNLKYYSIFDGVKTDSENLFPVGIMEQDNYVCRPEGESRLVTVFRNEGKSYMISFFPHVREDLSSSIREWKPWSEAELNDDLAIYWFFWRKICKKGLGYLLKQ